MSRKSRREVREAKAEYREINSQIKATKSSYQAANKRERELLNPQTAAEKHYVTRKAEARNAVAKGELKVLIVAGQVVVPFENPIPKNTRLFELIATDA